MEVAGPLGTPLGLAQRKRASPRGEAGTSGFLCVSDSDRSVTAELGQENQSSTCLRKGTPLASRVAQGVSGPSSSCVWNPRVFADDARGCQCCLGLCLHPQGCLRIVTSVVSDSVRPHRWQPTRLPRPWDPPGKNTGVGCHRLLREHLLFIPKVFTEGLLSAGHFAEQLEYSIKESKFCPCGVHILTGGGRWQINTGSKRTDTK